METTQFEDIYTLFLSSIQDHELRKRFINNPSAAEDLMQAWLLKATVLFKICVKDISNLDFDNKCFYVSLDNEEKVILSEYMTSQWYDYQANDLLNIVSPLQDDEFRRTNHYQSYRSLLESSAIHREKTDALLRDYSEKHYPVSEWW